MKTSLNPYRDFRFPAEVIEHAVWLYAAVREAGLPGELLETRHVRSAKAMLIKTDCKDARGIAQLLRLGIASRWPPRKRGRC